MENKVHLPYALPPRYSRNIALLEYHVRPQPHLPPREIAQNGQSRKINIQTKIKLTWPGSLLNVVTPRQNLSMRARTGREGSWIRRIGSICNSTQVGVSVRVH